MATPKRSLSIMDAFGVAKKHRAADPTALVWKTTDASVLVGEFDAPHAKPKIAAFDLDGTLITTKSGKRFPVDAHDWRLLYPSIPEKIRALSEKGYKFVLFTNQNGIAKGHMKEKDVKSRIAAVVAEIAVPAQIFAAMKEDKYRKPRIGSWELLEAGYNDDMVIDKANSFFCGDMAGRVQGWRPGAKKDALDTDRKFALNADIAFHTPEELFLQSKLALHKLSGFAPKSLLKSNSDALCDPPNATLAQTNRQEMIIMVGSPGCGKTSFCKRHLLGTGYVHINQDTLQTAQRCVAEVQKALAQGKSVVIDNTNRDRASRTRYLALAKQANVPTRCFVSTASKELCIHNNEYRGAYGKGPRVPTIAIHSFYKQFQPPELNEGFAEVIQIHFVPNFDGEDESARHFHMYMS